MYFEIQGAQWLSGRVLDSRSQGSGFEPHRLETMRCVIKQPYLSLISTGLAQEDLF